METTPINESSEGLLAVIFQDLQPLFREYAGGFALIPDDLRSLVSLRNENDNPRIVGWEYRFDGAIHQRGKPKLEKEVVIAGLTIVHGDPNGPPEELVLRRYVDWADVWAQLGVSAGRGELDEDQEVLDPENLPPAEEPGEGEPEGVEQRAD
jgi:hypothetical protein